MPAYHSSLTSGCPSIANMSLLPIKTQVNISYIKFFTVLLDYLFVVTHDRVLSAIVPDQLKFSAESLELINKIMIPDPDPIPLTCSTINVSNLFNKFISIN
jgi:hypothetical protein